MSFHPCHFLFAAVLLLAASAAAAPPVGQAHVYKRVDGRALKLYVTKPTDWAAGDRRPSIVFFHGGAWTGGGPGQFTEHSKYLASRGMVAVQVQYRLLKGQPDTTPPDRCIHDARSAMRWVRAHAAELGIDPQRIASGGASAGGHLAAHIGLIDGLDDPQDDRDVPAKSNAMVLFNPVFDNGPGGWGTQRVGDRYPQISPAHNVTEDDPPAIVFLGDEDKLVPVATVEAFQRKMEAAGVPFEHKIYQGQPHGFFNHKRSGGKYYYDTVLRTDRFLASLGWLKGPPTLQPLTGEKRPASGQQ